MRLLSIGGKNLASLARPFELDFASGPLARTGLFAIVGATGAGKSTILDAMCLALYGETPRSTGAGTFKVATGEGCVLTAQDPRHVVRRGAADAYACVAFEVRGKQYLAKWSVSRVGRGTRKGQLSEATMTLVDGANGEVIANAKKQTVEAVVRLTGLEFENFRRSVLLAQGEFAAFLQANAKERTKLLETLTDPLGLYRRLSVRAHQRGAESAGTIDTLCKNVAACAVLTDEELATLSAEEAGNQEALREASQKLSLVRDARLRWRAIEDASRHIAEGLRLVEEARRLQAAVAPVAAILLGVLQVAPLRVPQAERARVTERHAKAERAYTETADELARASRVLDELTRSRDEASSAVAVVASERRTAAPVLETLRRLEEEVGRRTQERVAELAALEALLPEASRIETEFEVVRGALGAAVAASDVGSKWLAENPAATALATRVDAWSVPFARYVEHATARSGMAQSLERARELSAAMELASARAAARVHAAQDESTRAKNVFEEASVLARLARGRVSVERTLEAGRTLRAHEDLSELATRLVALGLDLFECEGRQAEAEQAGLSARAALAALVALESVAVAAEKEAESAWSRSMLHASFEKLRADLVDGEACPVCGSAEHPFSSADGRPTLDAVGEARISAQAVVAIARSNVTDGRAREAEARSSFEHARGAVSAARESQGRERARWEKARVGFDSLPSAEVMLDVPKELEARAQQARAALAALEGADHEAKALDRAEAAASDEAGRAAADLAACETGHRESERVRGDASRDVERHAEAKARCEAGMSQALEDAAPVLAALPDARGRLEADPPGAVLHFRSQVSDYQRVAGALATHQEEAAAQLKAHERLVHEEALLGANRKPLLDTLGDLERRLAALEVEQASFFSGRTVAVVEADLISRSDSASAAFERARASFDVGSSQVVGLKATQVERAREVGELQRERAACDESFAALLSDVGVDAAEASRRLALPEVELAAMRSRVVEVEKGFEQESQRLADARKVLAELQAGAPELDDALLAQAEVATQEALEQAANSVGRCEQRADEHRSQLERREQLQRELAHIKDAEGVWGELASVIGHSAGDTFAEFAQVLSFEALLASANAELRRLRPRYALERLDTGSAQGPQLEFVVVDREFAAQVRPVSTLSGGERFLVSLALALGLAQLASHESPIGTMFIDEGFGSLDADTLAVATSVLDALQTSGAKVGIISHVSGLDDQIRTKVRVEGPPGGPSQLRIEG